MSENTVLAILNKTIDYFKSKKIEEARLDAQLLLSESLKISRMDLYLQFERLLVTSELNLFRETVRRRGLREPVQRILGYTYFRHCVFKVDHRSLIPRKETEILVDLTLAKMKEKSNPKVLEIGIGCGAILLSILKEYPSTLIQGSDIEPLALELTTENAKKNELDIKGKLTESNLFSNFENNEKWDIIVSNPPYLSEEEYQNLEPEVKNWDPYKALVAGNTGLECIHSILEEAFSRLQNKGWLLLEVGIDQSSSIRSIGEGLGFSKVAIHKDYAKINRFVSFQK